MLGDTKRLAVTIAAVLTCAIAAPHRAAALQAGVVAIVTYTGSRGSVSNESPLCLCAYTDADLQQRYGCYIAVSNGATFQATPLGTTDYYFIAFLDPNFDERLNAGESFGIYRNRTAPPADPVTAGPDMPHITITFGDEGLTPSPTPSLLPTETPTPSVPPLPTPTLTPQPCAGDCDDSGNVTVDEILTVVNIALGRRPLQSCASADTNGSNAIEITEILAAVDHALSGCGNRAER